MHRLQCHALNFATDLEYWGRIPLARWGRRRPLCLMGAALPGSRADLPPALIQFKVTATATAPHNTQTYKYPRATLNSNSLTRCANISIATVFRFSFKQHEGIQFFQFLFCLETSQLIKTNKSTRAPKTSL